MLHLTPHLNHMYDGLAIDVFHPCFCSNIYVPLSLHQDRVYIMNNIMGCDSSITQHFLSPNSKPDF